MNLRLKSAVFGVPVLALCLGCEGDLVSDDADGSDSPSGNNGGSESDPGRVDAVEVASARTIAPDEEFTTSADCYPMEGIGEHLEVSPDGQAWVVLQSDATEVSLQVLDPVLGPTESPVSLELPSVGALNVWSAEDASLSTADGLWRLEGFERIDVFSPTDSGEVSSFCGDFSTRAAVVSGGDLYEMRGDSWWQYSTPEDAPDVVNEIVRFDGACTDTDEGHWLAGDRGTIWRVGRGSVSAPIQIEGTLTVGGTAGLLGVRTQSQIWVSSVEEGTQTWQPWELPDEGSPTWLGMAGGGAWVISDSELYHFDGEHWSVGTEEIAKGAHFAAYATGVWLVDEDKACHYGRGAPIRLEGLRPFTQTRDQVIDVIIVAEDVPSVSLNGESLDVTPLDEGHHVSLRLDEVGWSEFSVSAGPLVRNVWVKRIPTEVRSWEADILPIYETNCANSNCHGDSEEENGPPDLGSFEAWVSRSGALRSHVVVNETMPPAANRGPEWSEAQREIVSEWLEGGLLP